MKIAMMVRGFIPAPRPADMIYAPIDLAVAMAEGLTRKGHRIDFFGPIGTHFENAHVNVHTLRLRALVHNQKQAADFYQNFDQLHHYLPGLWDAQFAREMINRAARGVYDILHFEHAESMLPFANQAFDVPIVCRLHDPVSPWYRELLELYDTPNQHFVSISNNQRRDAPDLNYLANIYNGTDVHMFPFSDKHEDYLLFVGRVVPDKGVKEAVDIARETGHRLLIIGPVYPDSQGYFDQYIKPHLNDRILYLGFIEQNHLPKYYQKAKALLTPVQREEPFGLTTIEAMACGTPVISLNRGAASEIIVHGKTGYVVKSITEMIKAVGKIDKIDRRACRDHVKEHFSHQTMVDAYEKAFMEVLQPTAKLKRRTKYVSRQIKKKVQRHLKPLQPHSEPGKQTKLML